MSSYHYDKGRTYLLIAWLVFIMPSLMAQDHVDTYFLKIELVPEGSKVTYIAANEIDSSEPEQFIITHSDISNHSALDVHKRANVKLSPDMCGGLLKVSAPYLIDSVKIIDKTGHIIIEKNQIYDRAFRVDMLTLKSGFYTLKIISNTKRLKEAG